MKSPKKSETLEIRLSHPDKEALREQAALEGRSISEIVRSLISNYLKQNKARNLKNSFSEIAMLAYQKPKSMLFLAGVLVATPVLIPNQATAEIGRMGYFVEYKSANETLDSVKTIEGEQSVYIDHTSIKPIRLGDKDLHLIIQMSDAQNGVRLNMTLCDGKMVSIPLECDEQAMQCLNNDLAIAHPIITPTIGSPETFDLEMTDGSYLKVTFSIIETKSVATPSQ